DWCNSSKTVTGHSRTLVIGRTLPASDRTLYAVGQLGHHGADADNGALGLQHRRAQGQTAAVQRDSRSRVRDRPLRPLGRVVGRARDRRGLPLVLQRVGERLPETIKLPVYGADLGEDGVGRVHYLAP